MKQVSLRLGCTSKPVSGWLKTEFPEKMLFLNIPNIGQYLSDAQGSSGGIGALNWDPAQGLWASLLRS